MNDFETVKLNNKNIEIYHLSKRSFMVWQKVLNERENLSFHSNCRAQNKVSGKIVFLWF